YFYMWIDLNNDLVFDDTEKIIDSSAEGYLISYSETLTIPALPLGNYRVRIGSSWSGAIGACGSSRGEYQDFTLTVVDVPSCMPPTTLAASNVTANTADLSWTSEGSTFDISWG